MQLSKTIKKISIISCSRADYGLLKNLVKIFKASSFYETYFVLTGSHFSNDHGNTHREILNDDIPIEKKIKLYPKKDNDLYIGHVISDSLKSFTSYFNKIKPELIIILGDRVETLSVAISAMVLRIPIAHLHGGEVTEGNIDEAIRHSISKMSHLHFVANEIYKKRLIQLGENPKYIHNVGGLGVDSIHKTKLISKKNIELKYDIKFRDKNIMITFHPVTLEKDRSSLYFDQILNYISTRNDILFIFTFPNVDSENKKLISKIKSICKVKANSIYFPSLGTLNYYSFLTIVDGVMGNSSSGITEVPSFKKGTINIGDRQKGRLKSSSIIDCQYNFKSIDRAVNKLYSKKFLENLKKTINPYGKKGASQKIYNIIHRNFKINNINIIKKFNDLK